MNISPYKTKRLVRTLLRENRKNGRPWRVIASEDYGGVVNYATLNRIAISKGAWLPKGEKILIALGLKQPCKLKQPHIWLPGERHVKRIIAGMAKKTRQAVLLQK